MPPDVSAWLVANAGLAALGFARALGLCWTAPALATPGLGGRFRLLLAGLLGLMLWPVVAAGAGGGPPPSWAALGGLLALEVLVGAALGWSAALVVAGARQAGDLVGAQAGFSAAALFDPEAGEEVTPLGHLYGLVALGVFLALDGPVALVKALAGSYRVIPAGGAVFTAETVSLAFARVGGALALALQAAAPVALSLTLASLALGLLGRAAPSLPLLALAMPVRAVVGLGLVFLGLAVAAATFASAWASWAAG